MGAKKEFQSIQTPTELIDFLREKANNHDNYHHYTNLENAIKIIKSGYWHLLLGDAMNDKQELTKGSSQIWNNTFISSFAFGKNENIAMWGLYSIPWQDAVRITIPKKAMIEWINQVTELYQVNSKKDIFDYQTINTHAKPILTDVVYIDGKRHEQDNTLRWNDNPLIVSDKPELQGLSGKDEITGYIKNAAWAYEDEVRIKVKLEDNHHCKKIAIKVPPELIDSLTIVAGPWITGDFPKIVRDRIEKLHCDRRINKTDYSGFRGLVDLRNACSMCKHQSFLQK